MNSPTSHSAMNRRIGIVGAGTSGVYLAGLLIQQGFQVDLFEKAGYPRTEGCGIFLVQAGMKALRQGNPELCQKLLDAGVPVQRFEFRNLRGGVISAEDVSYSHQELPGILVHRKVILETLLGALPDTCFHGNAELRSIEHTENSVIAHFQNGRSWEGDLLVGADGILSKVRQSVVPNTQLCYLGDLVWRGVVTDTTFCPPGHFIVYARGRGIYANFFDMGVDPTSGRQEKRTHWGFFIERRLADTEKGTLLPGNPLIPPQELAKLPADARAVIEATPLNQIVSRYSYDIDPLPHLYKGRVVLIGDAAHAKSPTLARGMTAGFEDAIALCRYLSESVAQSPTSQTAISEALAGFQSERLPIVHEYQRTSRDLSQKLGRRHKQAA